MSDHQRNLLPCPFCGAAARLGMHHRLPGAPIFLAECSNAECPMDFAMKWSDWNRRAPLVCQEAADAQS